MNKLKTSIVIASTCILTLGFVTVETPKVVHAAIATLVRDQDNAARHAFNQNCSSNTGNHCSITVPAGVEYVIQSVSLYASESNYTALFFSTVVNGTSLAFVAPTVVTSRGVAIGVLNGTFYADPQTTINIVASDGTATGTQAFVQGSISGYYVTLP